MSVVCGAGDYPIFFPKATLQIGTDLRPTPGLRVCLVSQHLGNPSLYPAGRCHTPLQNEACPPPSSPGGVTASASRSQGPLWHVPACLPLPTSMVTSLLRLLNEDLLRCLRKDGHYSKALEQLGAPVPTGSSSVTHLGSPKELHRGHPPACVPAGSGPQGPQHQSPWPGWSLVLCFS